MINLKELAVDENYITSIPNDPNGTCHASGVCYEVSKSANGRVTVIATDAELGETISVTR